MTFEFDGKVIGGDSFTITDNFDRADSDADGAWTAMPEGHWGISPSRLVTAAAREYVLTADVTAHDGLPGVVTAMNGWPELPIPAEAKAGDRIAWTIRDGVVVDTQINPPIPVE